MPTEEALAEFNQQMADMQLHQSKRTIRMPTQTTPRVPTRRQSWLAEVGADNTRRHSTSAGNQLIPGLGQSTVDNLRSQSFSGPQQNGSHKRFSSLFSAVSESAVEDDDFQFASQAISYHPESRLTTYDHLTASFKSPPAKDAEPAQGYYVVQFKLHRADVYRFDESYGLELNVGDLVMVEADRGHDLGKVIKARASYQEALDLVGACQRKHHDELMMFSRFRSQFKAANDDPSSSPTRNEATPEASVPTPNVRVILRKCQPSDIQLLQDKEGAEAQARRKAQAEANKLGFKLEILDAEFQFDYNKLTFSYYADSYIHFNPLVNSLFKMWKTRIWMSGVNSATCAPPSSGMPLSQGSGYNPSSRPIPASSVGPATAQPFFPSGPPHLQRQYDYLASQRILHSQEPANPQSLFSNTNLSQWNGPIEPLPTPPNVNAYDWGPPSGNSTALKAAASSIQTTTSSPLSPILGSRLQWNSIDGTPAFSHSPRPNTTYSATSQRLSPRF